MVFNLTALFRLTKPNPAQKTWLDENFRVNDSFIKSPSLFLSFFFFDKKEIIIIGTRNSFDFYFNESMPVPL